jgi:hypothetical protein
LLLAFLKCACWLAAVVLVLLSHSYPQLRHVQLARLTSLAFEVHPLPPLISLSSLTLCHHCSELHIYASLCVAALVGSFVGTWLRKFVLREVLTSLVTCRSLLISAVALTAAACRLSSTACFGLFGPTAPRFCTCLTTAASSTCLLCLSSTFCCRPSWSPAPLSAISTL